MRNEMRRNLLLIALTAGVVWPGLVKAGAIPPDPDNAALLYYQAFLSLADRDEQTRTVLRDVARGDIDPNDTVRQYVQDCRQAIETVEMASTRRICDWGVPFSRGIDVLMPQLSQARFLTFVLIADARLKAADGDYRGAFERCLMIEKFARHIGNDTTISYLVSIAVRSAGRKCMQDVVALAADDAEVLGWLSRELATAEPWTVSLVGPMKIEVEVMAGLMQVNERRKLAEAMTSPDKANAQEMTDFVATLDAETLEQAERLYRDHVTSMLTVLNSSMPYTAICPELKRLADDFDPNDPASRVAGAFMPAMSRIYTLATRAQAQASAVEAGVLLCLRRDESGQLPASLPAGLPKDPFSGEDFEYERTDDGFVLRCRVKENEDEDKADEYAFILN